MPPPAVSSQAAMETVSAAAKGPATAAVTSQGAVAGGALVATAGALSFIPPHILSELLTSGISVGCANTATNPLVSPAPSAADSVVITYALSVSSTGADCFWWRVCDLAAGRRESQAPAGAQQARRRGQAARHGECSARKTPAARGSLRARQQPWRQQSSQVAAQISCGCSPCILAHPLQVRTGINVVKQEGVLALWSGLGPSLARGFFFGGARLGLYTPIKTALAGTHHCSQILFVYSPANATQRLSAKPCP